MCKRAHACFAAATERGRYNAPQGENPPKNQRTASAELCEALFRVGMRGVFTVPGPDRENGSAACTSIAAHRSRSEAEAGDASHTFEVAAKDDAGHDDGAADRVHGLFLRIQRACE